MIRTVKINPMNYQSRFPGRSKQKLSSEIIDNRRLIFRITHIDNVRAIARYGLCSKNFFQYPYYRDIGANYLMQRRDSIRVPSYPRETGTLADYISFYFTPRSPMLHNVLSGKNVKCRIPPNQIVFFVSSLVTLAEVNLNFVFSDRHVLTTDDDLVYNNKLEDLDQLDWEAIEAWTDGVRSRRSFEKDKLMAQAEALVHEYVPVTTITKIVVFNEEARIRVRGEISKYATEKSWLDVPVTIERTYYYD